MNLSPDPLAYDQRRAAVWPPSPAIRKPAYADDRWVASLQVLAKLVAA